MILEGAGNAQYAEGYLLFVRQGALMAQQFDIKRSELTGEAVTLAPQIETAPVQADGARRLLGLSRPVCWHIGAGLQSTSRLVWFDRDGRELGVLGDEAESNRQLSPDGRRSAVTIADHVNGTRDIWIFDLARGLRTRLTSGARDVRIGLVWSPMAAASRSGPPTKADLTCIKPPRLGTGEMEPLWKDRLSKYPTSWSQDGRFILYWTGESTPQTLADVWILPLLGDRKPFPFLQSTFNEMSGEF